MDNYGKIKKKPISRIILFWLLIIVVTTFLIVSLGAFLLLAANSRQSILETVRSFTEYDIEGYKAKPAEYRDELLESVSDVVSLFLEGAETTDDNEELNHLLREWSLTEFMSELNLVNPDGIIVSSSNPDLIGYNLWQDGRFEALRSLFDQDDGMTAACEGVPLSETPVQSYTARKVKGQNVLLLIGATRENEENLLRSIKEEYLSEDMSLYSVGNNGYIFRADENLVVTGSNKQDMIGKTLPELGFPIEKGKEYSRLFTIGMDGSRIYAYGDNSLGFFIFYAFSTEEVLQTPIDTLKAFLIAMALVCLSIYLGVTVLIRQRVVQNMLSLNKSLSRITDGDLEEKVDVRDSREFDSLSDDINLTVDRLKSLIDQEARRIDNELAFAKVIQTSALPSKSAVASRKEIVLDAYMSTAREVGGDFYDFFLIDNHKLGLVIADVSGKGISAAMFMMRSAALIRDRALRGGTPGEILEDVNKALCKGNESELFVTVWLAILDLHTGKGMAVNAGHEYPAVRRASEEFAFWEDQHFPFMGAWDEEEYESCPFELAPGDCLFVYTDGVMEATNSERVLFGRQRMLEALNRNAAASAPELIKAVRSSISDFVGDADPFDDITMLCVEYLGPRV